MSATNTLPRFRQASKQRGTTAIEFSLLAIIFLTFVFGILELSRGLYLMNTLQEVTRRAAFMAANSAFDKDAIAGVQQDSLFRDSSGNLLLGTPITPDHIRVEYLSLSKDATGALTMSKVTSMPSCPARNRLNCLANPYSESCIRFVRVQVCDPGIPGSCEPVQYKMLFPLVDMSALKLPRSTTITPVQSLGYTLGSVPCT